MVKFQSDLPCNLAGGILTGGILTGGDFDRGDYDRGDFDRGDYDRGDFDRGIVNAHPEDDDELGLERASHMRFKEADGYLVNKKLLMSPSMTQIIYTVNLCKTRCRPY